MIARGGSWLRRDRVSVADLEGVCAVELLKPAFAYFRDSSAMQRAKGLSITAQRDEVARFAAKLGYEVVREFVDDGFSGRHSENREDWQAMLRLLGAKRSPVAAVIVWNSDRFARNLADASAFRAMLAAQNVKLLSVTEPNFDGPENVLFSAFLDAKNQMYSERLSQDVQRGMKKAAEMGHALGGSPPFGLLKAQLVNASGGRFLKYVPDPELRGYVVLIYELYASGLSMNDVAAELNRRGAPTLRGGRWGSTQVCNVLIKHQMTYLGHLVYNRTCKPHGSTVQTRREASEWVICRDAHEAIISQELADGVNLRRQNLAPNRSPWRNVRDSTPMLFAGKVFCGICGHRYTTSWGGKGGGVRYYSCGRTRHEFLKGRRGVKPCGNIWIRECVLDDLVVSRAMDRLSGSGFLEEIARALRERSEVSRGGYERRKAEITERLRGVRKRRDRLIEAIMSGVISHEAARESAERLDREISALERDLYALPEPAPVSPLECMLSDVERLRVILRDGEQRRLLALALIERVVVWPDRLVVGYQLPLSEDVIRRPRPVRVKPWLADFWKEESGNE